MKRVLVVVAGALVVGGCAPGMYRSPVEQLQESAIYEVRSYAVNIEDFLEGGNSEAEAVDRVKTLVRNSMKDPDSAKFRNTGIGSIDGKRIVCGEVNAKNSYGGYVGFRKFAGSLSSSTIESTGGRYANIDNASNAGIYEACSTVRPASGLGSTKT